MQTKNTPQGPNPSGLCMCGCGQPTRIARYTRNNRGDVAGLPVRYLLGHRYLLHTPEYVIDADTGCWLWQRAKDVYGYGVLQKSANRPHRLAHRLIYERHKGPIPPGLTLDHLCRNPGCVNPDHLEPVTHKVNVHRGAVLKLSDADVAKIRRLAASMNQSEIARLFGVHSSTINRIVRNLERAS